MIDYIHVRLCDWGRQIRKVYLGHEGWPSRSVLGKLKEEGILGAASVRFVQFEPEFLIGECLETNRAIKGLTEIDREILFVHYVVIGKGKLKAARLDMPRSTYYSHIDQAQRSLERLLIAGLDKKAAIRPGHLDSDRPYFAVA